MQIEIFTLCDFAKVYGGRLTILGPFDAIFGPSFPTKHHSCHLALRIRFNKSEEGDHLFKINIIDQDGKKIVPELSGKISVAVEPGKLYKAFDVTFGLGNLPLEKPGEYSVALTLDGREAIALPMEVIQREQPTP